eukprot:10942494-Prorocentrum_lima.AAC.1
MSSVSAPTNRANDDGPCVFSIIATKRSPHCCRLQQAHIGAVDSLGGSLFSTKHVVALRAASKLSS